MRTLVVAVALLWSGIARGQVAVSGTVRDSVASGPLRGAVVQIVADSSNAIPRSVVADSVGRYRIDAVGRGRYLIGFFHPMLDSLSLEPILRQVEVADSPVTVDLGIPSSGRLRTVFCGSRQGAAFVGVVRDAEKSEPIAGASVIAEWLDVVIGRGSVAQRPSQLVATTGANGWFAFCGVPAPGVLAVHARRGNDSTDLVDLTMPAGGFARRDLYVSSRSDARLSGRVVNDKGDPVGSAMISLASGARARANPQGEWTLDGLKAGTRILDVRAIGYYPSRRPVDVIAGAGPVQVVMGTFEAVLDTLRIKATGIRGVDEGGFEERRRSLGFGKFLSEEEIRRQSPVQTSDLFTRIAGLRVYPDTFLMRGAFADGFSGSMGDCNPAIFIDGTRMPSASRTELDSWVQPGNISGMEVYPDVPPPQFQDPLSGCGSIVIWTKRKPFIRKPPA